MVWVNGRVFIHAGVGSPLLKDLGGSDVAFLQYIDDSGHSRCTGRAYVLLCVHISNGACSGTWGVLTIMSTDPLAHIA
eukprot:scaffold240247_cov27-Tisochrysis_lutea.AAC.2